MIDKPSDLDENRTFWTNLLKWQWRFKSYGANALSSVTTSGDESVFCHIQALTGSNTMEHYIKEMTWDEGSVIHPYNADYRGTTYLPNFLNIGSHAPGYYNTHWNPVDGDVRFISDSVSDGGSLSPASEFASHDFLRVDCKEPGTNLLYLYDSDSAGNSTDHLGFILGPVIRYITDAQYIASRPPHRDPVTNNTLADHYRTTKYVEVSGWVSKSDDVPSDYAESGTPGFDFLGGYYGVPSSNRTVTISDIDLGDFTLKKKVIELNWSTSLLGLDGVDRKYAGTVESLNGTTRVPLYKAEPQSSDFGTTFYSSSY